MKKPVLFFVAVSMAVTSAFADGGPSRRGYNRQDSEPFKISEFFCGIVGGAAGGLIFNKAGANTPFTFLGALLGGVIGVNFCQYLNDPKQVGAQAAAFAANLDAEMCQERTWRSSKYHGTLKVLAESWNIDGGRGEISQDNICKLFETTIYGNDGRYYGLTKAWACKDYRDQWIITKENWISRKGYKVCSGYQWPPRGEERDETCGGTVIIGGQVRPPSDLIVGPIRARFDLNIFKRRINDYGFVRSFKVARRTQYPGEVEEGLLKAVSDDGNAVIIYFSDERQVVVNMEDVGVECRGSGLCVDAQVQSTDGLSGAAQYVFENGDIVINDLHNGKQLRPASMIVNGSPANGPLRSERLR